MTIPSLLVSRQQQILNMDAFDFTRVELKMTERVASSQQRWMKTPKSRDISDVAAPHRVVSTTPGAHTMRVPLRLHASSVSRGGACSQAAAKVPAGLPVLLIQKSQGTMCRMPERCARRGDNIDGNSLTVPYECLLLLVPEPSIGHTRPEDC